MKPITKNIKLLNSKTNHSNVMILKLFIISAESGGGTVGSLTGGPHMDGQPPPHKHPSGSGPGSSCDVLENSLVSACLSVCLSVDKITMPYQCATCWSSLPLFGTNPNLR